MNFNASRIRGIRLSAARLLAQWRNERGNIALLSTVFAGTALLVALGGALATDAYLARKELFTVADAAAVAAADAFDLANVHVPQDGSAPKVTLDLEEAERVAHHYVAQHGVRDARVTSVRTDTDSVTVTVSGTWHAPFGGDLLIQETPITVTASARSQVR